MDKGNTGQVTDYRPYYNPRVLLNVAELNAASSETRVLFLTEKELYVLKNMLAYAYRQVNWSDTLYEGVYSLAEPSEYLDVVRALDGRLRDMDATEILRDMSIALDCLCAASRQPFDYPWERDDSGVLIPPPAIYPEYSPPPLDDYQCKKAQRIFDVVRIVIDTAYSLTDILTNPAVAIVAGALVGFGVTLPLGVCVALVTCVMNVLSDIAYSQTIVFWNQVKMDYIKGVACNDWQDYLDDIEQQNWAIATKSFFIFASKGIFLNMLDLGTGWEDDYDGSMCPACPLPPMDVCFSGWEWETEFRNVEWTYNDCAAVKFIKNCDTEFFSTMKPGVIDCRATITNILSNNGGINVYLKRHSGTIHHETWPCSPGQSVYHWQIPAQGEHDDYYFHCSCGSDAQLQVEQICATFND